MTPVADGSGLWRSAPSRLPKHRWAPGVAVTCVGWRVVRLGHTGPRYRDVYRARLAAAGCGCSARLASPAIWKWVGTLAPRVRPDSGMSGRSPIVGRPHRLCWSSATNMRITLPGSSPAKNRFVRPSAAARRTFPGCPGAHCRGSCLSYDGTPAAGELNPLHFDANTVLHRPNSQGKGLCPGQWPTYGHDRRV